MLTFDYSYWTAFGSPLMAFICFLSIFAIIVSIVSIWDSRLELVTKVVSTVAIPLVCLVVVFGLPFFVKMAPTFYTDSYYDQAVSQIEDQTGLIFSDTRGSSSLFSPSKPNFVDEDKNNYTCKLEKGSGHYANGKYFADYSCSKTVELKK